ncbi:hypothetical protein EIP91_011724 [Steccherinum ochraceum]|uniref:Uncharacterized protein n=1 Tax=Steccherinum ochraceum TaxID=92696 RepID=A0A4R0RTI4_9APHY|nr:hypothetical protein EIP91_011724 [Steccherinum ochraceum]
MSSYISYYLSRRSVTDQPTMLVAIIAGVLGFNVQDIVESGEEKDRTPYSLTLSRDASSPRKDKQIRCIHRSEGQAKLSKSRPIEVREHVRSAQSMSARSLDADTASIYSTASAPMEFHDHLFRSQPFSLDPTAPPSAPRWVAPQESSVAAAILQILPDPSESQLEYSHEAVTQLLEQIDRLNHLPLSRTSSISRIAFDSVRSPPIVYLRSEPGTPAIEVSPQPEDVACVSGPNDHAEVYHSVSPSRVPRTNAPENLSGWDRRTPARPAVPPRVFWKT